jgi:hypothetical protein
LVQTTESPLQCRDLTSHEAGERSTERCDRLLKVEHERISVISFGPSVNTSQFYPLSHFFNAHNQRQD